MGKQNSKCLDCEKEIIQKYSNLYIEFERLKNYNALIEKCLDIKEELNKVLREDNENLRYQLKLWKEKSTDGQYDN